MRSKQDLIQGWIAKAESDLSTVRLMLSGPGPYDTACFHAQQAIEKFLKSYLLFYDFPAPRIHDLEELQRLCLEVQPSFALRELDLVQVTDYAVMARYDIEFWPERRSATDALGLAEQVREIILDSLHFDT